MTLRHLAKIHHLMADLPLPDSVKKTMQADLQDAALKGFVIDFEQLNTNLHQLSRRVAR